MKLPRLRILKTAVIAVIALALFAALAWCMQWRILAWYLGLPSPGHSVTVQKGVMVPMRDGVRLSADIYRPSKEGRYPVILLRTMYGKRNPGHKYSFSGGLFASQGYVFIVQDVRGKFDSEGEFYPYIYEAKDGHDTIEWAGTRDWSTGKVGTYGFSYWGSTQWLPAPLRSNYLKAMVPIVTSQDVYPRWIYNGIFRLNDVLVWHYENAPKRAQSAEGVDWDTAVRTLPLIKADDSLGADIPAYNDWINHPRPGPFWDRVRVDERVSAIQAPALIIDGWYDYYLNLAIDDYKRMKAISGSKEARQSLLLVGPWTHSSKSKFEDADFGKKASFMKQVRVIVAWFDYWLKGEKNGILDGGPVRFFTMGANEWRAENEWPPAGTRYTPYYLQGRGKANSATGDGVLAETAPAAGKPDSYVADPDNPVPSVGGTSIFGKLKAGPFDQRVVESRDDVLVYTTAPLAGDTEVTGPVKLVLYASSSARDTDFAVKLAQVRPDGTSVNVQSAVYRASNRESLLKPAPLEKDRVYKFEIEVGNTSMLFKKGHRIRLQIAGSNFPEYGRNLQTGDDNGTTDKTLKARQTVFHDREHPSRLILPITPR
ncbi:MAG: CocE/NonD family hydrolase [Spirochaetes bacterium]|nr:CocE/NonD family hydrolase [Spirochaetota bacterium]